MKAAILAGGAGTRLYPITAYVPKTLIPIGKRYVIEYIIDYLKHHGIRDLLMLISENEFELIRNHLGDGARFGVKLDYSVAERVGTAGALAAAKELLGDRFVIYYGDVLTNMNLKAMIDFHVQKRAVFTIALSTSVPVEYGVGKVAESGQVTYFEEKPILKEYPVSIGVYVAEKETLEYCKPNTDLAGHVVPALLRDGKPVYAYLTPTRHYDIGTFKSLEEVRDLLESRKPLFHTT